MYSLIRIQLQLRCSAANTFLSSKKSFLPKMRVKYEKIQKKKGKCYDKLDVHHFSHLSKDVEDSWHVYDILNQESVQTLSYIQLSVRIKDWLSMNLEPKIVRCGLGLLHFDVLGKTKKGSKLKSTQTSDVWQNHRTQ